MYTVLLANADINIQNKYCEILANDKELNIATSTDGLTTIKKYFELKPDILILDTNIGDLSCIEKLNQFSTDSNKSNKSTTILTTQFGNSDFYLTWGQKVAFIVETTANYEKLSQAVQNTKYEIDKSDAIYTAINKLFIFIKIGIRSDGAKYFRYALHESYNDENESFKLQDMYTTIQKRYPNVKEETIRNKMRSSLNNLKLPQSLSKDSPLKDLEVNSKNTISPAYFLNVCVNYLDYINAKK